MGGSLTESGALENHVSDKPAAWFSELYKKDGLRGGHVIQLGPGNRDAALSALSAFPKGLQLGGGVNAGNARQWLDAGASQVIVTSFLFEGGQLSERRLKELAEVVRREELVIDLSCRRTAQGWQVATDRWQTVTDTQVTPELFDSLAEYACEFLVHAADVEGLCRGIDTELVQLLGEISTRPCTYAGGASSLQDLSLVSDLSQGRVHLTFGSALDVFGGKLVRYQDCVAWNQAHT